MFDISNLNNYGLNKLINHDSELSILAVESIENVNNMSSSNFSLNGKSIIS